MKTLSIAIIGVKGGATKCQNVGYVSAYSGNNRIMSVDSYKGCGDTYQQRQNPVICIFDLNDTGNCIFEGTHEQLINRLKETK